MFSGSSEEARIDESLTAGNINFLSSPPPSPPSQHQTGHSHSYQGEAGLSGQTLGTEKKTIQIQDFIINRPLLVQVTPTPRAQILGNFPYSSGGGWGSGDWIAGPDVS